MIYRRQRCEIMDTQRPYVLRLIRNPHRPPAEPASPLTDEQWNAVLDAFDGRRRVRAQHSGQTRRFIDGTLWIARTGLPWSQLPGVFGDKRKCYVRFTRWAREGVWASVIEALGQTDHHDALSRLNAQYLLRQLTRPPITLLVRRAR